MISEHKFTPLLAQFIRLTKSNKRRKQDGSLIANSTAINYDYFQKLILKYEEKENTVITIYDVRRANKREMEKVKKYWAKFYRSFTDFLYNTQKHFDNNVGQNIKQLRSFFNWLNVVKGITTGDFYKQFHVPKEDIPIITLEPEQLHFLIYDLEFENQLPDTLKKTKDIFVIGCTVALRFSDIKNLKKNNLEYFNDRYYISMQSQKTQTRTRIMLPEYAINILRKYKKKSIYLLPVPEKNTFNKRLKKLIEHAGWTHEVPKVRMRKGKPIQIQNKYGKTYRFYDLVSSHCMRRTAISTMLRMGLEENLVRKVSGHAAGSKEFYKYVQLSQTYMDEKMVKIHREFERNTLLLTNNKANGSSL
jgi:integrase